MVADLLETHQESEHRAAPGDAIQALDLFGERRHRSLVQPRLHVAERTVGLHLSLVGQIGNDALVALQAPQDVGLHQVAQGRVVRMLVLFEAAREAAECLAGTQQSGANEIEQRPQIAQPVLYRRAGEREPHAALQGLDRLRLTRCRILDGLRFIEHHQRPMRLS